jgi:hypothetical protein
VASKRITPAATATFRLSTPGPIGMETASSEAASQRSETPLRSFPTTSATPPERSAAQ